MSLRKPFSAASSPVLQSAIPLLDALEGFFRSRSSAVYLVGGFLRDVLLDRPSRDVDLAVTGDAVALARSLARLLGGTLVPLDEAHSIARVVLPLKEGGKGTSATWQVDLASFSQGIERDLARRDFTIDALALPLDDALRGSFGEALVDPFGGLSDLATSKVKAVSPQVFQDDPVRLLRGVRLAAQLGFSLDQDTQRLARRDAHLVSSVAPERLRDELLKTLAEPGASAHLRLLDDLGLLCRLIPELEVARGVTQPKEHYWDVFYHCLETSGCVERVTSEAGRAGDRVLSWVPWHTSLETYFQEEVSDGHNRRTIIKLAGLLHDIAKPATRTIEPGGRMRFFGHDSQGAKISEGILRRLRLSSRGVHLVSTMIEHHLRPTQMNQGVDMPTRRATYRYFRDVADAAIDTLYLNLADYLSAKGPVVEDLEDWRGHCDLIGHILHQGLQKEGTPQSIPRLVDGHTLMQALGLFPGPDVGRLLDAIHEAQGSGEVITREEALDLARRLLKEEDSKGSSEMPHPGVE
ncbi:MAG: HD domain-containing protein [Chloroflexi bacterium]|nr:HD domain-containing protein [Chloroflexota bacterium]